MPSASIAWRAAGSLLPPLPPEFILAVRDCLPKALRQVWPLPPRRRRALSADVNDLSRLLTCERGAMSGPYWNRPGHVSAYLYYFLPWNIIRLGTLLSGLKLPDTAGIARPLLIDAGSGPLTLPLALWLAKPELRSRPIKVLALDACQHPLRLGSALFEALADLMGQPAWEVQTVAAAIHATASRLPQNGRPWLITAANVLNELKTKRGHGQEAEAALLAAWEPIWRRGSPAALFVEPGTRLGGTAIMRMREAALESGLVPLAPCVHAEPCPLLEKAGSWCHFVFSAQDAPGWLKEISREARLFKTSLSLAPLFLSPEPPAMAAPCAAMPCRVISQDFPAGGRPCRYGCAACGLCLLPDAPRLLSGSLTLAEKPAEKGRNKDAKSGATILKPAPAH